MSDDLPDDSEGQRQATSGKAQDPSAPTLNEMLARIERGLKYVPALQVVIGGLALATAIASWWVARSNAEMVRQFNSNTQRPYVGMETVRLIEPDTNSFQAQVVLKNFGNVPAKGVKVTQRTLIAGNELNAYSVPHEDVLFPGTGSTATSDLPMGSREKIKRGELTLELDIKVDYSSFMGQHTTGIRLRYERGVFIPVHHTVD